MGNLINFLYNWQQLIGALLGALIAISGSIGLTGYLTKKAERKKQYSNLLLTLQDIKRFIGKCELYLDWDNKRGVPFDKIILNDKINYFEPIQAFGLRNDVYTSIDHVYSVARVISYSFRLSEVLETHVKKKKGKEVHTQRNIVSGKHRETIHLVKFYLRDIYGDYNIIAKAVERLSKKYKYLRKFDNINLYKKDYVEQKNKEYGLDKAG